MTGADLELVSGSRSTGRKDIDVEHEVHNGDQVITFTGELLGQGTSARQGRPRWHEVTIYRTTAGEYVVSKIGYSNVQHRQGARCARRGESPQPYDNHRAQCSDCQPRPGDSVIFEVPYCSAFVSDTPEGAVASLYSYDAHRTRKLTIVAEDALRQAGAKDSGLIDAFQSVRLAS